MGRKKTAGGEKKEGKLDCAEKEGGKSFGGKELSLPKGGYMYKGRARGPKSRRGGAVKTNMIVGQSKGRHRNRGGKTKSILVRKKRGNQI